jgi:putative colanic acid biosynthesis UDP-glucose lipid carrier transferase
MNNVVGPIILILSYIGVLLLSFFISVPISTKLLKKVREMNPDDTGTQLSLPKKSYLIAKRVFDLIFSSIVICILSPVFLLVGFIIKLTSKGPVLVSESYVGKNLKFIYVPQFRVTYYDGKNNINHGKLTKVGRFLYHAQIVSLPSLFSVLKGDMSFIGISHVLTFNAEHLSKLEIQALGNFKPGVASLYALTYRNLQESEHPEKFDLYYIKRASFWFDFLLLFSSLSFLIKKPKDE